jgi:hypothetical protein
MTAAPVDGPTPDLVELERLAKAATRGPWQQEKGSPNVVQPGYPSFDWICTVQVSNVEKWADNAAFIAAANPERILALLDALTAARTEAERAREALLELTNATLAYDTAIFACSNDPDKMSSFCSAQGDDLDTLYADWMAAARKASAYLAEVTP